jgi:hypothetical protein
LIAPSLHSRGPVQKSPADRHALSAHPMNTKAAPKSGFAGNISDYRLAMPMSPVIPTVVGITPMSRGTPVTTSPRPMVIAPSPAPANPHVARCGTNRYDLNDRDRHGRLHNDRGRSNYHRSGDHYHRSRGRYDRHEKWDSEAYTDVNASACSCDSQGCQGQDCDCLFHIDC